jgi:toxin CcdB
MRGLPSTAFRSPNTGCSDVRDHVYRNADGFGLLLDVQADVLDDLATRTVVPLLPLDRSPPLVRHLNPTFTVAGEAYVMMTNYLAAIPASELRHEVGSLAHRHADIIAALDFLLTGV